MVQVTRTDGTVQVMAGSMNDKLFAWVAPSQRWASYKLIPDETLELSEKDKELKAYCEHHDMYGYSRTAYHRS